MTKAVLQINQVSFGYPNSQWRLEKVSLEICAGEVTGIIGPNGSGKSTLLKIAAGVLCPSAGEVSLTNQRLSDLSRREIAQQLGYLPQNVTSTFDYRVEELVAMGRFPYLEGAGFLQHRDLEIINRCLEQTETADYHNRPISQLSGGERQRVMLASVLAQEPKILLLDEPTTGLDPHHQSAFFNLLRQPAQKQTAVAVVTHDLNMASQFCDRLLLLHDGRVVTEGPVREVFRQEILSDVYRQSIYVSSHPLNGQPIALPMIPK